MTMPERTPAPSSGAAERLRDNVEYWRGRPGSAQLFLLDDVAWLLDHAAALDAEAARLRPVYDAACEWRSAPHRHSTRYELRAAIDAARAASAETRPVPSCTACGEPANHGGKFDLWYASEYRVLCVPCKRKDVGLPALEEYRA